MRDHLPGAKKMVSHFAVARKMVWMAMMIAFGCGLASAVIPQTVTPEERLDRLEARLERLEVEYAGIDPID